MDITRLDTDMQARRRVWADEAFRILYAINPRIHALRIDAETKRPLHKWKGKPLTPADFTPNPAGFDHVDELLGVVPGSVGLAGVDCDKPGGIETALDAIGNHLLATAVSSQPGRAHLLVVSPAGVVNNANWALGQIRGTKGYLIIHYRDALDAWARAMRAASAGGRTAPDLARLPGLRRSTPAAPPAVPLDEDDREYSPDDLLKDEAPTSILSTGVRLDVRSKRWPDREALWRSQALAAGIKPKVIDALIAGAVKDALKPLRTPASSPNGSRPPAKIVRPVGRFPERSTPADLAACPSGERNNLLNTIAYCAARDGTWAAIEPEVLAACETNGLFKDEREKTESTIANAVAAGEKKRQNLQTLRDSIPPIGGSIRKAPVRRTGAFVRDPVPPDPEPSDLAAISEPVLITGDPLLPAVFERVMLACGYQHRYNIRNSVHELKRGSGPWRERSDQEVHHLLAIMPLYCYRILAADAKKKPPPQTPWRYQQKAFYDAMAAHAFEHQVDPFVEWLESLPQWDGTERNWIAECFPSTANQPLAEWASRSILLSAVWRAYKPGYRVQEIPVLQGHRQGTGKSAAFRWLFPESHRDDWFTDGISFSMRLKEIVEAQQKRVICEFSELTGVSRADTDHIKKVITSTNDGSIRRAYRRDPESLPRRNVWVASANAKDALPNDPTGNRRFTVISVAETDYARVQHVTKYLDDHREQLWAQAVSGYAAGIDGHLPDHLKPLQEQVNETVRRRDDMYEELVRLYMAAHPNEPYRFLDIVAFIKGPPRNLSEPRPGLLSLALKACGLESRRVGNRMLWYRVSKPDPDPDPAPGRVRRVPQGSPLRGESYLSDCPQKETRGAIRSTSLSGTLRTMQPCVPDAEAQKNDAPLLENSTSEFRAYPPPSQNPGSVEEPVCSKCLGTGWTHNMKPCTHDSTTATASEIKGRPPLEKSKSRFPPPVPPGGPIPERIWRGAAVRRAAMMGPPRPGTERPQYFRFADDERQHWRRELLDGTAAGRALTPDERHRFLVEPVGGSIH